MDRDALARRLMATFLAEMEEHVRTLNAGLVALEKGGDPARRPELVAELFRAAHSLKGASRSVGAARIETACHRMEGIFASVRDGSLALGPEQFGVLFAAVDGVEEAGARLRDGREPAGPAGVPAPPVLPGARAPEPAAVVASAAAVPGRAVRIPAARLDRLLDLNGELQVARRRGESRAAALAALRESVGRWRGEWRGANRDVRKVVGGADRGGPGFGSGHGGEAAPLPRRAVRVLEGTAERLDRLEDDLESLAVGLAGDRRAVDQAAIPLSDEVRRARMLPFAEVCEGLDRVVRDLAAASGKIVDLVVEGGAAELDREVLDRLKDPLVHLVRNAVGHGIEPPEVRRAAGKPELGRVTVAAAVTGSDVVIAVRDDGRGLDGDAIGREARRRGLPPPEGPHDLVRLAFQPGFSTATAVTEVSGRGVGLDVVKSRVEALHGAVECTTFPGRGTAFSLRAPVTLAAIRALLVSSGGGVFAVPNSGVRRLLRAGPGDLGSVGGRDVVFLADGPVPVVPLAAVLGLPARDPARPGGRLPVAVLASGEERMAFAVEEFVAEAEVVVKGLGRRLKRVRGMAGATVLPDGRVAMILSVGELLRAAAAAAPAASLASAPRETAAPARKRLLVVDDSITTRTLVRSILDAAGYEVTAAADGAEAWMVLQEAGSDLVVADVEMPRLDGVALTQAIRASKRFRDLPVVLVTAMESEADRSRGLEAGADAYLLKSAFDQARLLETIGQLL
ncbi:MAG: response regulator [Candidatus Coatesbacteria bacterium]